MEANKRKFCYWLIAITILLSAYGQSNIPEHRQILQASGQTAPVAQSFHQNYALKFTAEAAAFEGITISGRSTIAEDKNKPYARYIVSHPPFDVFAQLANVYIHRFSTQVYFSLFLYLLYCVLII